jgi:D-alanyl-D-alanine carboxypeptidase
MLSTNRRSTMPIANGNRLSRRRLLSNAAAATSLALVAPQLGRPSISLAHTGIGGMATVPNSRAATPSPGAPPATLDAVLQAGLDRGIPGVALRVERGDEVIFDGAAGLASLEQQTPVAPTDRFGVGSITKTFTATLVLQLVDAGVLTLDDTVSQWLDNPVVARIPHVDEITLRQLLNHTSGVYDYFDDDSPFWQDAYFGEGADWARVWTPMEALTYADGAKHAPYFAPGEGIHYTNTGYVLLGLIVEEAIGQSYAERLHARILDPLGLEDTFYAATEPVPGGKAEAYQLIEGKLVNVSAIDLSSPGAAGGMVSTTRDLARFAKALFGGELLRPATLEEMVTFIPSGRPNLEAGFGVFRWQTPSGELVGNSGDGIGSAGRMYQLADTDLTLVLLANTSDAESVDAVFTEAVRVALETAAPNS